MKDLCIIIPAYNEEFELENTVLSVLEIPEVNKIFIIDNNSNDRTSEVGNTLALENDKVEYHFESKQGKGNAFLKGLSLSHEYAFVGLIDADSTYPASMFSTFYKKALINNYDMVVGNRMPSYKNNDTRPGHLIGNLFIAKLVRFVSGIELKDALSGMRLFSRKFLDYFDSLADGFQLETEFSVTCGRHGLRYHEIEVNYKEREETNPSKLSTLKDGFSILRFALSNSVFSYTAKATMLTAFFFLIVAISWSVILVIEYFEQGRVTSVASAVAVSILASLSIQLYIASSLDTRMRRIEKYLIKR